MIKAPYQVNARVFQSDDGWSYRIIWSSGDEVLKDPADGIEESKKAYKTDRLATRAMVARMHTILLGIQLVKR